MRLDQYQRAAAEHTARRLVIIAGAGAGKTATVVGRVRHFLKAGVDPARILLLTFTNRGAAEMRGRIGTDDVLVSTFHALALRLLRESPRIVNRTSAFVIWGEQETIAAVTRCAKDAGAKIRKREPMRMLEDPAVVRRFADLQRACNALTYDALETGLLDLLANDSTGEFVRRFDHVLVDEYQDTSEEQDEILRLLYQDPHDEPPPADRSVTVIGDPRQSIFGWRKARIENMLAKLEDPAWTVVTLRNNYRSVTEIVTHANRIADAMNVPWAPPMQAAAEGSGNVRLCGYQDPPDEARGTARMISKTIEEGTSAADIAVLARSWGYLDPLVAELRRAEIPLVVSKRAGSVWDTTAGAWISACVRFGLNPDDDWTCEQVAREISIGDATVRETESRLELARLEAAANGQPLAKSCGTSMKEALATIARMVEWNEDDALAAAESIVENPNLIPNAEFEPVIDALEDWQFSRASAGEPYDIGSFLDWIAVAAFEESAGRAKTEAVSLSTVHGFKGAERDVVFVLGMSDGVFPISRSLRNGGDRLAEELRLYYVAVTRPRRLLQLSHVRQRPDFKPGAPPLNLDPSRYLAAGGWVERAAAAGVKL